MQRRRRKSEDRDYKELEVCCSLSEQTRNTGISEDFYQHFGCTLALPSPHSSSSFSSSTPSPFVFHPHITLRPSPSIYTSYDPAPKPPPSLFHPHPPSTLLPPPSFSTSPPYSSPPPLIHLIKKTKGNCNIEKGRKEEMPDKRRR